MVNVLDEITNNQQKQFNEAATRLLTALSALFLTPYLIKLIWNWQLATVLNVTLTYWQWFWLIVIVRMTHPNGTPVKFNA